MFARCLAPRTPLSGSRDARPLPAMPSASQKEAGGREVSAETSCQPHSEKWSLLGEPSLKPQQKWGFCSCVSITLSEWDAVRFLLVFPCFLHFPPMEVPGMSFASRQFWSLDMIVIWCYSQPLIHHQFHRNPLCGQGNIISHSQGEYWYWALLKIHHSRIEIPCLLEFSGQRWH